MATMKDFLQKHQVKDLLKSDFKLIEVNTTTTILETLRKMIKHRISFLPVYDQANEKYIGFTGILDLVTVIAAMEGLKEIITIFTKKKEIPLWEFIEQEKNVIAAERIQTITNLCEREVWHPVNGTESLYSLCKLFVENTNIRCVPVIGGHTNNELVGVISPMRVLEFILEHLDEIAPSIPAVNVHSKLDKSNWGTDKVHTISEMDITINAILKMTEKNVSGLAVVDANGELCGSLSATDLKGSTEDNLFPDLYLPVQFYLDKSTPLFLRENSWFPIRCKKEDSLKDVLQKIVSKHVHRLFVTNHEEKPIHVICLRDILGLCMHLDTIPK